MTVKNPVVQLSANIVNSKKELNELTKQLENKKIKQMKNLDRIESSAIVLNEIFKKKHLDFKESLLMMEINVASAH